MVWPTLLVSAFYMSVAVSLLLDPDFIHGQEMYNVQYNTIAGAHTLIRDGRCSEFPSFTYFFDFRINDMT